MGKRFNSFILLTPAAISLLLAVAHFARIKQPWFGAIYLFLLVVFLFFREQIIAKIIQGALMIAACEWIRATFVLVSMRIESGDDWIRLAVILLGVAGFTFASALVFWNKSIRALYGSAEEPKPEN